MNVIETDDSVREQIRASWKKRGATASDIATFDNQFSAKTTVYAVKNNGKFDAVFDIRTALQYTKNMTVLFAPDFRVKVDEID